MKRDDKKLWFIRGILVATASNRQTITYDELRRLCRLNDEQIGTYLGKAREILSEGEPDYCSIVVKTTGVPGGKVGVALKKGQVKQSRPTNIGKIDVTLIIRNLRKYMVLDPVRTRFSV